MTTTTGLFVPLYSWPGSTWSALISVKQLYPSVPMLAVINPNNGDPVPVPAPAGWLSGIQALNAAGIGVIAYIHSSNGSASLSYMEQQVTNYRDNYGPLYGIWCDEMNNTASKVSYYQSLNAYIKNTSGGFGPTAYTIGNPGTTIDPACMQNGFDNMCIYEDDLSYPPASLLSYPFTKSGGVPDSNCFSAIALNCPSYSVAGITAMSGLVKWVYATSLNSQITNPYASFPWIQQIAQTLDSLIPPPDPPPVATKLTVSLKLL